MNKDKFNTLNRWLESKFIGIDNKFDDSYISLEQQKYFDTFSLDTYNYYYNDNDVDIKNNLICDKHDISLNEDNIMKFAEIYEDESEIKIVVTYPSINRSHCNFLFKMIMDCVSYNEMQLFFRYVASGTTDQNISMKQFDCLIMTVDDKLLFYNFCYDNSIQKLPKLLLFRHIDNVNVNVNANANVKSAEYKNLSKNVLLELANEINDAHIKYYEHIEKIWNEVLVPYLSGEYKMIFGKINERLSGYDKFMKFMLSLPSYQLMTKIKAKIDMTLAIVIN